MLSELAIKHALHHLSGIVKSSEPFVYQLMSLGEVYSLLLTELTKEEEQLFSNSYARAVFVYDRFMLPEQIVRPLERLRRWVFVASNRKMEVESYHIKRSVRALCKLIVHFDDAKIPTILSDFYADVEEDDLGYGLAEEVVTHLELVVIGAGKISRSPKSGASYFSLVGHNEEYGKIKVLVREPLHYLSKLVWRHAIVRFSVLQVQNNTSENAEFDQTFFTNGDTLVCLEPDLLFDATAIASCRSNHSTTPLLYVLRKYLKNTTNYYTLRGMMVNDYLDHHLQGQETCAETLFAKYAASRPSFALLFDKQDQEKVVQEVETHYQTLSNRYVQHFQQFDLQLEPAFISEKYGIKGRLDVLVNYPDSPGRKDVIELKTSKLPNGTKIDGYVRPQDVLQANCYNLLLQSANEMRNGSSAILYSSISSNNNPLRNAPNDIGSKRRVLYIRNHFAHYEHHLSHSPKVVLDLLSPKKFAGSGIFSDTIQHLRDFYKALHQASLLEQAYFHAFTRFIAREQRAAKVGAPTVRENNGYAALWRTDILQKERRYGIIAWMHTPKVSELDSGKRIVIFKKTEGKTQRNAAFRKGDAVIIYPQEADGSTKPTNYQLIKASVVENNAEEVVLTPYSAYLNAAFFEQHPFWAIEPELYEQSYDAMYACLGDFLQADASKRQLLLGTKAPSFKDLEDFKCPSLPDVVLNDRQKLLLEEALSAQDYYLLQGPPGTGKTKVMLRAMVKSLLAKTDGKIVLLAYTNRAVDEICAALLSMSPCPDFVRLGHGDSTEFPDILLQRRVKDLSLGETRFLINKIPVYVSTVLTFLREHELRSKLDFKTAIVDEASQLLEPQLIGILSSIDKIIMIGDEKQLPAVVLQSDEAVHTEAADLQEVGLFDLRVSLFERLLHRCKEMGWSKAYGMLEDQGRMHEEIQAFPNEQYYDGRLRPISDWQFASRTDTAFFDYTLPSFLHQSRWVYVASTAERRKNVNEQEAHLCCAFIRSIRHSMGNAFDEKSIGVITPYRAQIAQIRDLLSAEENELITVDTVERYQGGQRKIIIFSFAVNTPFQLEQLPVLDVSGKIDKKLNVALTRAKEYIIVLGNRSLLSEHKVYGGFMSFLKEKAHTMSAKDILSVAV